MSIWLPVRIPISVLDRHGSDGRSSHVVSGTDLPIELDRRCDRCFNQDEDHEHSERIVTAVALAVLSLLVVYLVFAAVSRGNPEGGEEEIEVGLLPPKIRRRRGGSMSRAPSKED